MTNVSMPSERLTITEFMTLYEVRPFEIIDGKREDLPPTVFGHSNIAVNLLLALNLVPCLLCWAKHLWKQPSS